jgi:hypothetical protein
MVPRDLLLAEAEEAGRIVIKNVAFLFLAQERRPLDHRDGALDHSRPDHLIGAEHYPLAETCFHDSLQVAVKLGFRQGGIPY